MAETTREERRAETRLRPSSFYSTQTLVRWYMSPHRQPTSRAGYCRRRDSRLSKQHQPFWLCRRRSKRHTCRRARVRGTPSTLRRDRAHRAVKEINPRIFPLRRQIGLLLCPVEQEARPRTLDRIRRRPRATRRWLGRVSDRWGNACCAIKYWICYSLS
jgi:hypothetical protein